MRVLVIALLTLAGLAPAAAADLKLLTAGAFKSVAQELVADFERKTGHKVTIQNDTAGGVARRVREGEYVDVVVMPPGAMGPGGMGDGLMGGAPMGVGGLMGGGGGMGVGAAGALGKAAPQMTNPSLAAAAHVSSAAAQAAPRSAAGARSPRVASRSMASTTGRSCWRRRARARRSSPSSTCASWRSS